MLSNTIGGGPSAGSWARAEVAAANARAADRKARRTLGLRLGERAELELLTIGAHVDLDLVAGSELAQQDLVGQGVLNVALDRALQGPRPERLVVAMLDEELTRMATEPVVSSMVTSEKMNLPTWG